jgi:3-dehydroquinate synthase II
MKRLWVSVIPYNKQIAIAALESGAEALVLPEGQSETVRQFGRIKTVEKHGDLKPGVDVEFIDIAGKTDEDRAAAVPPGRIIVLKMLDWTIIPIENLLARRGKNLMVQVANSEQAKLMVEILERGVDGVVLDTNDVNEIKKTAEIIHGVSEKISLVAATVTATRQLGMGDRSCLDTCTQMTLGEGMLVGNTAAGFFLVHSESIDNPSRRAPSGSTPAPYTPISSLPAAGRSISPISKPATRSCWWTAKAGPRPPTWAATRSSAARCY